MGARIQVGERNGNLVVIADLGANVISKLGHNYRLQCDCGQIIERTSMAVRVRKRCPDCSKIHGAKARTTHGGSIRSAIDPIYSTWQGIKNRCTNPNQRNYQWYGAKGVTLCAEWRDFSTFREWMVVNGWQPGLTIDRANEAIGYCPENCSLVTQSENAKRMRRKYEFVKKSEHLEHTPIELLWGPHPVIRV